MNKCDIYKVHQQTCIRTCVNSILHRHYDECIECGNWLAKVMGLK